MNLLLTGATGLSGAEVLRQALADPEIKRVTVLTRRATGTAHPKLDEIILADFLTLPPLQGYGAFIWCLGVPQNDVSEADYIRITHDYALAAAKNFLAQNPNGRFCFLSGQGADQDEKSLVLFGRIKGRTERALSALAPAQVFHFRPGYIQPTVPRARPRLAERVIDPFTPFINKLSGGRFSVTSAQLARSLIGVAKNGAREHILDNRTIRAA